MRRELFATAVEERVEVGELTLVLVRPPDAEALLDEEAFEREELLPYWAELWPSAVALARHVARLAPVGARVVELGCGLALPSIAAALGGGHVLATDWAPDALAFAERNAALNEAVVQTLLARWNDPEPLAARGPFDLVLAADVLYERRNVDELVALLPRLVAEGGTVVVADPGRPYAARFLEALASAWSVDTTPDPLLPRGGIHRLRNKRHRSDTYP